MTTPPPPDATQTIALFLSTVAPSALVLAFAFAGVALGRLVVSVGGR